MLPKIPLEFSGFLNFFGCGYCIVWMTAYCSIIQSHQGFLQVIKKNKCLKIKNSLWFNLHFEVTMVLLSTNRSTVKTVWFLLAFLHISRREIYREPTKMQAFVDFLSHCGEMISQVGYFMSRGKGFMSVLVTARDIPPLSAQSLV